MARKISGEDYALVFLALGFTAFAALQLSHVPSYLAQFGLGVIVMLAGLVSAIVTNYYFRQREEIEYYES